MSLIDKFRDSEYGNCITHECPDSDCQIPPIKKDGATFSLKDTPVPYILVDCDKPPIDQNKTRCDFIFVANAQENCVCPIEMTSGKKTMGDAVSQLQAGSNLASRVIEGYTVSTFRPVLFGEVKGMNQKSRADFKSQRSNFGKIKFGGKKYPVRVVKGKGKRLADALF